MTYEKSCGAVVYKIAGGVRVFLIEHMALGHVSIPKGHVEKGETEEQTATREIKEETNLDVKLDTRFRHTVSYQPCPGIRKDVVFFVAEAVSDSLINQECEVSSLEWLPFEEACRAVTYETDRETLEAAKKYLDGTIRWCAIGDSFTYLNDHLDETGNRVAKGYLSRILDKVPGLVLNNIGINGSTFRDWIGQPIPAADLYTVLLGTNDWHQGIPMGSENDFQSRKEGTILGNCGILLDHIREAAPKACVIVGNPVERADFVYLLDPENNARGSYAPEHGLNLSVLAEKILACCAAEGIHTLDCHNLSGFTPENAVRYKRVRHGGIVEDLPYPDYIGIPFNPKEDPYPYPPEAIRMTYDGLHPSDEGCEILANLFAGKIRELINKGGY